MLMTPETKNRLLNNVETRLNELTYEVDQLGKLFIKLESCQKFLIEQNIPNTFENLINLLNFRIIIGIINLDLCAAVLTYLRGKFKYEAISSSRQIIVVINEGYKKIYNFIIENDNGDKISKHRNNSFWIKEVGQIITKEFPESKPKYDTLTAKLDNYLIINFVTLKTQRDLSVHYDKEPMKVYRMLIELDIEDAFKKLIPFLDIINELFTFTSQLNSGFLQKAEQTRLEQDRKIDSIVELIDQQKTSQNEKIINKFKKQILSLKNLYRK